MPVPDKTTKNHPPTKHFAISVCIDVIKIPVTLQFTQAGVTGRF